MKKENLESATSEMDEGWIMSAEIPDAADQIQREEVPERRARIDGKVKRTNRSQRRSLLRTLTRRGSMGSFLNESFDPDDSVLLGDRNLILKSPVQLTISSNTLSRYFFLYEDILICAKQKSPTNFHLKTQTRLREMWVTECSEETPCDDRSVSFLIGWPTLNAIAAFPSSELKDLWEAKLLELTACERDRKSPSSAIVKIVKNDERYSVTKSLLVGNSERANNVLARCINEFHIVNDAAENFQLCVQTGRNDLPIPLVGHEILYCIQSKFNREQEENAENEVENDVVDATLHFELVVKEKKTPLLKKKSFTFGAAAAVGADDNKSLKKASPISRFFKTTFRSTDEGRLFRRDLEELCKDGKLCWRLMMMLSHLFLRGPTFEGVFRKSASLLECQVMQEKLDRGKNLDFDRLTACEMSQLLKMFLRSLPECLLTFKLYPQWIEVSSEEDKETAITQIRSLVVQLPECNLLLLRHLVCVLHRIVRHRALNRMTSESMAVCIGQCLLWGPPPRSQLDDLLTDIRTTINLARKMLDHAEEIFGNGCLRLFDHLSDSSLPRSAEDRTAEDGDDARHRSKIRKLERCDVTDSVHDPAVDVPQVSTDGVLSSRRNPNCNPNRNPSSPEHSSVVRSLSCLYYDYAQTPATNEAPGSAKSEEESSTGSSSASSAFERTLKQTNSWHLSGCIYTGRREEEARRSALENLPQHDREICVSSDVDDLSSKKMPTFVDEIWAKSDETVDASPTYVNEIRAKSDETVDMSPTFVNEIRAKSDETVDALPPPTTKIGERSTWQDDDTFRSDNDVRPRFFIASSAENPPSRSSFDIQRRGMILHPTIPREELGDFVEDLGGNVEDLGGIIEDLGGIDNSPFPPRFLRGLTQTLPRPVETRYADGDSCNGNYTGGSSTGHPHFQQTLSSPDQSKILSSSDHIKMLSSFNHPKMPPSSDHPKNLSSSNHPKILSSSNHPKMLSSFNHPKIPSSSNYPKIPSSSDFSKVLSSCDHLRMLSSSSKALNRRSLPSSFHCIFDDEENVGTFEVSQDDAVLFSPSEEELSRNELCQRRTFSRERRPPLTTSQPPSALLRTRLGTTTSRPRENSKSSISPEAYDGNRKENDVTRTPWSVIPIPVRLPFVSNERIRARLKDRATHRDVNETETGTETRTETEKAERETRPNDWKSCANIDCQRRIDDNFNDDGHDNDDVYDNNNDNINNDDDNNCGDINDNSHDNNNDNDIDDDNNNAVEIVHASLINTPPVANGSTDDTSGIYNSSLTNRETKRLPSWSRRTPENGTSSENKRANFLRSYGDGELGNESDVARTTFRNSVASRETSVVECNETRLLSKPLVERRRSKKPRLHNSDPKIVSLRCVRTNDIARSESDSSGIARKWRHDEVAFLGRDRNDDDKENSRVGLLRRMSAIPPELLRRRSSENEKSPETTDEVGVVDVCEVSLNRETKLPSVRDRSWHKELVEQYVRPAPTRSPATRTTPAGNTRRSPALVPTISYTPMPLRVYQSNASKISLTKNEPNSSATEKFHPSSEENISAVKLSTTGNNIESDSPVNGPRNVTTCRGRSNDGKSPFRCSNRSPTLDERRLVTSPVVRHWSQMSSASKSSPFEHSRISWSVSKLKELYST